jgi:hypothetical protein
MKRGDVNWFVVSLIIVVITLAIFLVAIMKGNITDIVDRETCKESIMLRGAVLPGQAIDLKSYLSLQCKTKNICITSKKSGKGDCEGLGSEFETRRVLGDLKQDKIKSFLAQELTECWNMFGQGQLQIFPNEFAAKKTSGIICSKIQFDKSITDPENPDDAIKNLSGLKYYMITHKIQDKNITYMDFLLNNEESMGASQLFGDPVYGIQIKNDVEQNDQINLEKIQSIFYVETDVSNKFSKITSSIAAIGSIWATKGRAASVAGASGYLVGGFAGGIIDTNLLGIGNDQAFASTIILGEYEKETFDNYQISGFYNI